MANEVWMMENATYSILSPEGFASILWKDGKRAKEAAEIMKITAKDLKEMGIIERVIAERKPADMDNISEITDQMKRAMKQFLFESSRKTPRQLTEERYERFRKM